MPVLLTPEYCRSAAQGAHERAAATHDCSLSDAYKQLALDYEALAAALEVLYAKDEASAGEE